MTAHELAKKLLEGPDVMVTVNGYEGGVYEVGHVSDAEKVCLNVYPADEWWYGPHDYERDNHANCGHKEKVDAVHIVGVRK